MPRYKVEWNVGGRRFTIGTLVFNDDEDAAAKVTAVCQAEKMGATIIRPDRKRTVAIIPPPHDKGG